MSVPCSLEHCHTNLFALQSLNDMKWKCFRRALNSRLEPNHYKDPVLIAYWNALRADTLCAWRRVLADDGQKTEKELWLFGINEDLPTELPNLRPMNQANGSWSENALSYDCRSMLFKALHNMIEKYLLSKGFARLNKWFVLPINDHSDVKVPNYSFNFNFFLHGDNKVCASVDVQRHRDIFNLTPKDFDRTSPLNVILAPYGLNGMLMGHVSRDTDMNSLRENWERNYSVRHVDGLPDFVEVTAGNIRMFYPTCCVYKIVVSDELTSNNEGSSSSQNKKSEASSTKKNKSATSSNSQSTTTTPINTPSDLMSNNSQQKNESSLLKNLADQLLTSAQRNNCIDLEKKQESKCLAINDPTNRRVCRCHQCLASSTRLSTFIPFHRRPRTTPPVLSDSSSSRIKAEPIKTEHPSESIENNNILGQNDASTSSPIVNQPLPSNQPDINEKTTDWSASTPNSVNVSGPPSVLAPITNFNSLQTNSPIPAATSTRGLKRSATVAFDDLSIVEDEEREQHKQTYDFHRTDTFLQLPLKRFRADTSSMIQSSLTINNPSSSATLTTTDHVYRHGQPTPPSPSHLLPRTDPYEFDDDEDSTSRTIYPPLTPTGNARTSQSSFYPTDGPSMSDLETIIDSHEINESKNVLVQILSNGGVKSPMRKENPLPPPPPPPSSSSSTSTNAFPLSKSLNGVFHEMEQIYNTPPGSSSSEKLQALHSPYAIMVDSVSSAATTFDTLNQFSQESIIVPFESITVEDHSSYHPLKKSLSTKSNKRYEPAKSFSISITAHHKPFKHWKRTLTTTDYCLSPFNNNTTNNNVNNNNNNNNTNSQQMLRQQHTPRSMDIRNTSMSISNVPTPTMYSPMNNNPSIRSTDLQSSPFPIRSVGSVQAMNSPTPYSQPTITNQAEVDSLLFNVLLNDSILNLFRDMNFDSCVLCACTPNELNIRGTDSTIYLEKPRDLLKLPSTPTSASAGPNPGTHSPYHPHMYAHQQSSYHIHPHSAMYPQQQTSHHQVIPSAHSNNNNNNNNNNTSCSCGFSAVVNLRLSHLSGLFYEDEVEITGIKADLKYRRSNDHLPVNLLELIERKECFPSPFDYFFNKNLPASLNHRKVDQDISQISKQPAYQYENFACRAAIEQSRNVVNNLLADDLDKHHWLHQWSYATSPLDSDQQLITMLRSLQPLLVEALKKRNVNGLWSTIDGPLTWKSFHQLLYVQNQHVQLEEQIVGPQPIPYVLAGLDREWVVLAPYSLKFWDKLCLEPYSKGKDIAYVCIVPENDYICSMTKTYFRELSTHYELCRLGVHRPLLKAFADQGLLRIPNTNNDLSQLPNVDQWFTDHETTHPLGTRLKLYAQTIKGQLLNLLSTQTFDNTLLEESTSRRDVFRTPNDMSNPSSTLDLHSSSNDLTNSGYALSPASSLSTTTSSAIANNIYTTGSATNDALGITAANPSSSSSTLTNGTLVNGHQVDPLDLQAFESFHQGRISNDEQFFIVIYLVDTFRYELTTSLVDENGNANTELDDRLDAYVKKAIFRAYMDLIKDLPDKISIRINIQIIPFESIINQQVESDSELRLTQLKRLAFNVYGQLKRTVSYMTRAKSLTGFGPAASEEKMPAKIVMQLYTPAYILSPKSDFRFKAFADISEQTNINGSVLFCSYCLSDDQRYLLASCSDDRGELLETCSINIEVPDRHRRKVQHARRIGLQKLWDFIIRIVTSTTMPWRIVIGRLGRLGHGELKSWGIILSKKNLVRCATLIRESCPMCHILRCHDQPVILSACLISMETHPSLTVLSESLELGEMRGTQPSNNNTTTMQSGGPVLDDVSVTHILTLPTSASVQHVQTMPRPNDHRSTADNEDDLFSKLFEDLDPEGPPNEAFDNITSPTPVDLEFSSNYGLDMNHTGNTNGLPSGQHNRLGNPSNPSNDYNGNHPYGNSSNGPNHKSNSYQHFEYEIDMNDNPSLHQQPLALGFYVSTIGTLNPLPLWMLHGKLSQRTNTNTCSVFKATLHVSVPNAQHSDDMLFAQSNDQKLTHPLDSNYTYVVLRHVLESYNRLSWLLIDAKTNERASCLPIHMETLLRLYHAFVKFV